MKIEVNEIMSTDVIWVDPEEDLFEALNIMRNFDIRHLPVIDPMTNKLLGLLSEGDIILYCQKNGQRLEVDSEILVKEAMTKNVIYCYPNSDVANVAATMVAGKIDSMPVLDEEKGQLVGIVTTADFLDQLCIGQELSGETINPLEYNYRDARRSLDLEKSS